VTGLMAKDFILIIQMPAAVALVAKVLAFNILIDLNISLKKIPNSGDFFL